MRRVCGPLLLVVILCLSNCGEPLEPGISSTPNGVFPELRPLLDVPEGYTLTFRDGPDFYVWVMTDNVQVGERYRSGIGMYFGLHPNPRVDEASARQIRGQLCSRQVIWWVERIDSGQNPWVRRDAVIKYEHGKGFLPILLHVWIWGETDDRVAELARHVESLQFSKREHTKPDAK
jgi:hypothetical protein